jgi:hypothetical protein
MAVNWPTASVSGLIEGGSQAHLVTVTDRLYTQRKGTKTKYGAKLRDAVERIELMKKGGTLSLDITVNNEVNAGLYEEVTAEWVEQLMGTEIQKTNLDEAWQ